MSNQTPNERIRISEALRQLSALNPDPANLAGALERVRLSLESRRTPRRFRWAIGAALVATAALLALAIILLYPGNSSSQASAAEQLATAAATSRAFAGWVHIHREPGFDQHMNTMTGADASRYPAKDGFIAEFRSPPDNEEFYYESATNELRIGDMGTEYAANSANEIKDYPLTIDSQLKAEPSTKVTQSRDGELDRFDLSDPTASGSIWADPTTKLVQRATFKMDGGTLETTTYSYGAPNIETIYDLGVPRDAKVIDNRVTGPMAELLARLESREKKGFGTCVAVETEQYVDGQGNPDREESALTLYAEADGAMLACRYLVGSKVPETGGTRPIAIDWPKGWPQPEVASLLPVLKAATPSNFLIVQGAGGTAWSGFWDGGTIHSTEMTGKWKYSLPIEELQSSLPGHTWPTRHKLGLFGTEARAEIVTDAKHAGLIGLHIHLTDLEPMEPEADELFWLDPARDDLMVESDSRDFSGRGGKLQTESLAHVEEFAQLKNGQWYPSRWHSTTIGYLKSNPWKNEVEYRLQIYPDQTLGKEWYADPAATRTWPTTRSN